MKNLAAYTSNETHPDFISFNQIDKKVRVTIRPKSNEGYGPTAEINLPLEAWQSIVSQIIKSRNDIDFLSWSKEIHQRNVNAGWWSNLQTGESILHTRNRAELLLLVISELSEADFGIKNDLRDDKLPHLPMFNVEIADVAIRLFDTIGSEISRFGPFMAFNFCDEKEYALTEMRTDGDWFKAVTNRISAALEHLRKERFPKYRDELNRALATTFAIADLFGFDLVDVINQKLEFNANREDHKIENRKSEGGKKI